MVTPSVVPQAGWGQAILDAVSSASVLTRDLARTLGRIRITLSDLRTEPTHRPVSETEREKAQRLAEGIRRAADELEAEVR
jgi:acyl-CoA reductase-like NAD-dependent aldehyde dehydrogenase